MSLFPTRCPPLHSWIIADPDFHPEKIWGHGGGLIKEAKKRKVIKVENYYIKAFRLPPWPVGNLRDPAKKEWLLSKILAERALSPSPVAFGKSGRWSYFVSKEASGLVLERYLIDRFPSLSRQGKREIEKRFATFIDELAKAGILQPDFHLNNIFFQEKGNSFLILDLHRARVCKQMRGTRKALDQLVFILPPFMEATSQRAILETASFLSHKIPGLKDKGTRYHIQQLAFKNMRTHWAKKAQRKIKQNQILSKREGIWEMRHTSTDKAVQDLLFHLIKDPEKWLEERSATCKIIKNSRHTLCLKVFFQDQPFFIKVYRSSGWLKSLSYLVRKPRAVRTWELSWLLSFRNIPVLLPLAAAQGPNPWSRLYGAVIFPWIKEVESTKVLVTKALEKSRDYFLRDISFFLWQMHERGVVHGDCKITNFVYFPKQKNSLMTFDLDATKIRKEVVEEQRISDICCMCRSLENIVPDRAIIQKIIRYYTRFHIPWQNRHMDIVQDIRRRIMKKGLGENIDAHSI